MSKLRLKVINITYSSATLKDQIPVPVPKSRIRSGFFVFN